MHFLFSGTVSRLNDNSFDILAERTQSRKNYLQNEMVQKWSALAPSETAINAAVEDLTASATFLPDKSTRRLGQPF